MNPLEVSLNCSQICHIHLHANILERDINPSFLPTRHGSLALSSNLEEKLTEFKHPLPCGSGCKSRQKIQIQVPEGININISLATSADRPAPKLHALHSLGLHQLDQEERFFFFEGGGDSANQSVP